MTYKERPKAVQLAPARIRGVIASNLNTMKSVEEFREWLMDHALEKNKYGYVNEHSRLYEELLHALGDAEDTKELVAEAMEFYRTVPKDQRGKASRKYVKTGNADAPPTEKQIAYLKKLGYRESDGVIRDRKTAGWLISQLRGAQFL